MKCVLKKKREKKRTQTKTKGGEGKTRSGKATPPARQRGKKKEISTKKETRTKSRKDNAMKFKKKQEKINKIVAVADYSNLDHAACLTKP